MIKIYKYFYFIFFLILILSYLTSLFFFYYFKENLNFESISETQNNNEFNLYLSGVYQNTDKYKFYNIINKNPELLVIGSSRSMSLRGEYFTTSFYNAGGTVNNFKDLINILSFYNEWNNHKESKVILVLDPWWFLKNKNYNILVKGKQYNLSAYEKLINKKVNFIDSIKLINSFINNPYKILKLIKGNITLENIGNEAIMSNSGFDNYGSFHYDGILESKVIGDIKFKEILDRSKNNEVPFTINNEIDFNKLNSFNNTIQKLTENNIEYLIIFTPFENKLINELKINKKFKYFEKLLNFLNLNNIYYHDYSFNKFNSCEFIDSYHIGDVIAARILIDINRKNTITNIDLKLLEDIIKNSNGRASWHAKDRGIKEIDFLDIGCEKH